MTKKIITQTVQLLFNPAVTYADISGKINTLLGYNTIEIAGGGQLDISINQYLVNKTMADPDTGV